MLSEKIEYLRQFVTEERYLKLCKTIDYRTKYIVVVAENIYQQHNASAIVRNCEIFGVQNLFVIENEYEFCPNPDIVMGAAKWIDIKTFNNLQNNTYEALQYLKNEGYRIVATSPHKSTKTLSQFDIEKGKFALVFGSEKPGISEIVEQCSDEFIKIEMFGLTDSLNVSVSVGILLHYLTEKLHKSNLNWQLSETEKQELLLQWLCKSIKDSDKILKRYENERSRK